MPKITFFFYSSQPRFKTVSTVTMGLKHFSFQRLSLAFPKDKTGDKFARHNLLLFSLVWNVSRSDTSLHTSSPFWSETKLNVRQDDDDDDGIDAHAVVVDVDMCSLHHSFFVAPHSLSLHRWWWWWWWCVLMIVGLRAAHNGQDGGSRGESSLL